MEATNPLLAELLALQAQLQTAEAELTRLNNGRTQLGQYINYPDPRLQAADRAASDQQQVVNRLRELVDAKQMAVAAYDAAVAAAVATGLTPEAAVAKVEADTKRKAVWMWVGVGAVVVAIVVLIVWYLRKKKKA